MLELSPIQRRLDNASPDLSYLFRNWPLSEGDAELVNHAFGDLYALIDEVINLRYGLAALVDACTNPACKLELRSAIDVAKDILGQEIDT